MGLFCDVPRLVNGGDHAHTLIPAVLDGLCH